MNGQNRLRGLLSDNGRNALNIGLAQPGLERPQHPDQQGETRHSEKDDEDLLHDAS